jgi:anhydro-N-acetylmuramic acid kinase
VKPEGPFVGMISGTSRDGVDAAVVAFPQDSPQNFPQVLGALCRPYPAALAARLDAVLATGRRPTDAARKELDRTLAAHFADTALTLLREAGVETGRVAAIGSHGQTVWHQPDGPHPESMQLGDPAAIARHTGIVTVGDFRRADIEAGGQGAPLAPLLHRALFHPGAGIRVVLNLGGIANVSVLAADGSVSGFDTGPANCLLDAWIRRCRGEAFDNNGGWAAGGRLDPAALERLLADPWFARPGPKSTGTEYFNLAWLQTRLGDYAPAAADLQATLAELTAASVADAIRPFTPGDVLVCGGGVHNTDLLRRLGRRLPDTPLRSTADCGLDPDWVEAVLFAWLARERLAGRAQDTRGITGARAAVLLGRVFEPAGV